MSAEKGSWSVYLLCWRRHGGLQYIGMSQDVDRRINAHRKAGRLPFAQLGDPAVEVLHFGLDAYAACDAERREIMASRTMTPHGYNESSGGEYAGSRSDALFSSDHLHRLSRAAVGVERMDRDTHEEEAGSLAASGVEAVMERYWEACSVVVELWRSGVYVGRIARRAGLGHGYICGMRGRTPNDAHSVALNELSPSAPSTGSLIRTDTRSRHWSMSYCPRTRSTPSDGLILRWTLAGSRRS